MAEYDNKTYLENRFEDRPQLETKRYLQYAHGLLNLPKDKMRVLDYGCGVGASVRAINQDGFNVYGTDIDEDAVNAGNKNQISADLENRSRLRVMSSAGTIPFPDEYFDFVYSQEVYEHIENLDTATAEISRVTKPGGMGFHVYRAPLEPIEPHFFMPIVHWLPKNRIREKAISFWAHVGVGERPPQLFEASARQRAAYLYDYSVTQTFYASTSEIDSAFRNNGIDTLIIATNHRKLRKSRIARSTLNITVFDTLVSKLILTFCTGSIFTRKPLGDSDTANQNRLELDGWSGKWKLARK